LKGTINRNASNMPGGPRIAWIAAEVSTTAVPASAKHGSSGQKWLPEYAPIRGPAITSVSTAPTMAKPGRMSQRHRALAVLVEMKTTRVHR
jgi:hypothetical protein